MIYRNKKNSKLYRIASFNVINSTNSNGGDKMVLYECIDDSSDNYTQKYDLFVRNIDEFMEKFEPINEVDMSIEDKIKFFKCRVKHYFFEKYKMHDYELFITEQDKSSSRASTYWHEKEDGAQMITISYSKNWIEFKETTLEEMNRVAFHEVWEAILSEIHQLSLERFVQKREIPEAIHRVIRRLENIELGTFTE